MASPLRRLTEIKPETASSLHLTGHKHRRHHFVEHSPGDAFQGSVHEFWNGYSHARQ
jgi:hypothetical protein